MAPRQDVQDLLDMTAAARLAASAALAGRAGAGLLACKHAPAAARSQTPAQHSAGSWSASSAGKDGVRGGSKSASGGRRRRGLGRVAEEDDGWAAADAACCTGSSLCAACRERWSSRMDEQQAQSCSDADSESVLAEPLPQPMTPAGSTSSAASITPVLYTSAPAALVQSAAGMVAVPLVMCGAPWQGYPCAAMQPLPLPLPLPRVGSCMLPPSPCLTPPLPVAALSAPLALADPKPRPARGTGVFLPKLTA